METWDYFYVWFYIFIFCLTGMGLVCALGDGACLVWQKLRCRQAARGRKARKRVFRRRNCSRRLEI